MNPNLNLPPLVVPQIPMTDAERARFTAELEARREAQQLVSVLTDMEVEVLRLMCAGVSYTEMPTHTGRSKSSSWGATMAIRKKLGVGTSMEAAVIATRAGLV